MVLVVVGDLGNQIPRCSGRIFCRLKGRQADASMHRRIGVGTADFTEAHGDLQVLTAAVGRIGRGRANQGDWIGVELIKFAGKNQTSGCGSRVFLGALA